MRTARLRMVLCLSCHDDRLLLLGEAQAVPSFAAQTGEPCTACHIGAFGPQLTPLGRAFKIGGYTQTGGRGDRRTGAAGRHGSQLLHQHEREPAGAAESRGFARNNNFALDQVSLFLAGRITDNLGGFVQGTYSGTDRAFSLDNTDIRLTAPFDLKDSELRLGVSLNNGPTVQDPYNSTYAWIFPFATSALAPMPTAQPLIAGGLLGNSIGARPSMLVRSPTLSWKPGSTTPMARPCYPRPAPHSGRERPRIPPRTPGRPTNGTGTASPPIWARLFLYSDINPATATGPSTGAFGRNSYTDFASTAATSSSGTVRMSRPWTPSSPMRMLTCGARPRSVSPARRAVRWTRFA